MKEVEYDGGLAIVDSTFSLSLEEIVALDVFGSSDDLCEGAKVHIGTVVDEEGVGWCR